MDGTKLAFSAFVNNFGVSSSYIRNIVDKILEDIVMTPETAAPAGAVSGSP